MTIKDDQVIIRKAAEIMFEELAREYEANSHQIAALQRLETRNTIINTQMCILGELLGINDLDRASSHIIEHGSLRRQ